MLVGDLVVRFCWFCSLEWTINLLENKFKRNIFLTVVTVLCRSATYIYMYVWRERDMITWSKKSSVIIWMFINNSKSKKIRGNVWARRCEWWRTREAIAMQISQALPLTLQTTVMRYENMKTRKSLSSAGVALFLH